MRTASRTLLSLFSILGLALFFGLAPNSALAQTQHKFAMILPGPIEDADYNYLGYQVVQDVEQRFKLPVSYSERISPPDAERVAREYIASGHNIVAFHGGQFVRIIQKLAPKFPEVNFVMESSGRSKLPKNVWNIARRWPEAFHAFGVLAGMSTKTNKVGVIVGIPLPDFKGSVNTIWDALKTVNPKAKLIYAFTGDQNDPVKGRQTAEAQIASGADFIISLLNLGVYGVIEAAKQSKTKVLLTTHMTDKTDNAPRLMAASLLADFRVPYRVVLQAILKGQRGGYIEMRPGAGMQVGAFHNVSPEAVEATNALFGKVTRREVPIRHELKAVILN
jgi:basic membrane lipoprotein Med (substrate-binding protein (PBP1-ABC) superfamily)